MYIKDGRSPLIIGFRKKVSWLKWDLAAAFPTLGLSWLLWAGTASYFSLGVLGAASALSKIDLTQYPGNACFDIISKIVHK